MQNYPHINKSSWIRMGIIVSLLLLWTAGVTFVVSYVSPLDEIVQTAPLDQKEADNATREIARLTLQRDSASVLNLYAKNLHESYLEVSERLKKALVISSTMTAGEAFQRITKTLSSEEINASLNLLDNRSSYGNRILSINYRYDQPLRDTATKAIEDIYVEIWEPIVGMAETAQVEFNRDAVPVGLSLIKPGDPVILKSKHKNERNEREEKAESTYLKDKYTPIVFGSKSRENYSRRVSNLLPDLKKEVMIDFTSYTSYIEERQGTDTAILKWIDELAPNPEIALRNKFQSAYQEIHTALNLHVTELKSQADFFKTEKDVYDKKLNALQKRLRSSDSLFYVATVRAFLVTVVVISIGFVLIRAFAAELTQMRRMSYLEISSDMAAKYDQEKLPLIPELVRAVGGDKGSKSSISDGAPPDAVTTAESIGKALSKYLNPDKS